MSKSKRIHLIVPTDYEISEFVKGCNAKDSSLLIDYGETLLKSHKTILSHKVESSQVIELNKNIGEKELKLDQLRKMVKKLKNGEEKAKREHEDDIIELKADHKTELINKEKQTSYIKTKAYNEFQKHLEDVNKIHTTKLAALNGLNQKETQLLNSKISNLCSEKHDEHSKHLVIVDDERKRARNDANKQCEKIISTMESQVKRIESEKTSALLKADQIEKELIIRLEKERELRNESIIRGQNVLFDKFDKFYKEDGEARTKNSVVIETERKKAKEEASNNYNKIVSNLEKQVQKLENEKAVILLKGEKREKELNLRLDDEREKKDSIIKESQKVILDKINPLLKYFQCDNMIDKGNKGENMAIQILKKYYNNAVIKDVSGEAHSGDIHFTLDNMKCLIEVKREKTISSKDIPKFLDDVKTQCSNINCALFISLETENIPKRGSFYIEVICNIPVLYLYLYNNDCIKHAINILQSLTHTFSMKTKKEIISTEFQRTIKELISNQYSILMLEKKRIDTVIKQLSMTIQSLKKGYDNMDKSLKGILSFYDDNEDMRNDEIKKEIKETSPYTYDQMKKLEEWTVKNGKPPKRDNIMKILEMTHYDINQKGSVRKLQNILKQLLVEKGKTFVKNKEMKIVAKKS